MAQGIEEKVIIITGAAADWEKPHHLWCPWV
jgi:hypothetical protein